MQISKTLAVFLLFTSIMLTLPAQDDKPESAAKLRGKTRLGLSLFVDYWDFNASYDSQNSSGTLKQSGDIGGGLTGLTLLAFSASEGKAPIFGELSYRTGELTGDIRTSGNTTSYLSASATDRQEIEFRLGTVLRRGTIDVNGSIGGLFINSDTEQTLVGGTGTFVSSFSASTYLGTLGIDLISAKRAGQFSYGARLDSALLLGAFDPEYGDGGFAWGYDTRLTAFVDYEIPLERYDLVFLLKVGGFARDYFGQEAEYSDAAEVRGAYIRAGISAVF